MIIRVDLNISNIQTFKLFKQSNISNIHTFQIDFLMKTHIFKITLLLTLLAGLSACSDWLTIKPDGKVVLDDYWKNEADVEAVVAACYRGMLEDEFMKRVIVWGELRSDNIIGGNGSISDAENKMLQASIIPTNDMCRWGSFYTIINYCNYVLYYAPNVIDPNFTETKLHAKEAEVLTLRALCYFYLVRTYKDVPLIIDPSISDIQNYKVPQSAESQVLDKIEKDLLKAESWAMLAYGSVQYTKGRITKNAVRALLADVYLWKGNYSKCIEYCDKIIDDKMLIMKSENKTNFLLIQNDDNPFTQIFGLKNSEESIFELQFSESNKVNQKVYDYYGTAYNNIGQLSATTSITSTYTVYPKTDVRRKDNIKDFPSQGLFNIFKYAGQYRSENSLGNSTYTYRSTTANWIFYRLTDIMLMKAEALVQLNRTTADLTDALHIVNTIFIRSNPTMMLADSFKIDTYSSKQAMEELVLLERQRELMFEGKRWFDLLRMARRDGNSSRLLARVLGKYTDNQTTIKSKMTDMNSLYLPIHQDEMDANTNLVQNPFYLTESE